MEQSFDIKNIVQKLLDSNGDVDALTEEELTLTIKIKGEGFDSSITGEVARSLWELQENLYRSAAFVLHGQPNIKKLSQEERDNLTLTFKIKEGCTDASAGIKEAAKQFGKGFREMDSPDKRKVFTTFIVCALLGISVWQTRVAVSDYFEKQAVISNSQAMVDQASALVAPIEKALDVSAQAIAKATRTADHVAVGKTHTFDREQIETLNTKSDRQPALTETYDSSFSVVGLELVDSRFKIALIDDADPKKETMYATLPKDNLFCENLPTTAEEIATVIGKPSKAVRASILIRETKTKVDRILISWEPYDRNETVANP